MMMMLLIIDDYDDDCDDDDDDDDDIIEVHFKIRGQDNRCRKRYYSYPKRDR